MFCVLNVEKRQDTIHEKLFGRFIKDEYKVKMIPVFKAAPFYTFDVVVGKRGVDWDKIVQCAGKCAKRMVLRNNIPIPQNDNIGVFVSGLLYRKMMENTFVHILENNGFRKNKASISIIDNKGDFAKFLFKIASFASTLTVATDFKEKYKSVCDEIQAEMGLCAVAQLSSVEAQIKIDTGRMIMTITNEKNCINITEGCDFTVPEIYEKLLPENTDKYCFYSALYELCGVFSLGDCIFDTIVVNNEKINVQELHFS